MATAKVNTLTVNENSDFDVIAVFDYNAINDNATSANQATVGTIPAGGSVLYVGVYEATALVGASDITLDVGTTSGDPDEFIDALDVDGMTVPVYNTGDLMVKSAATTTYLGGGLPVSPVASATPILAEWNGTVGDLTAGEVVIGIKFADLGRFAS